MPTDSAVASSVHRMPFGATLLDDGVRFRIFAPAVDAMRISVEGDAQPRDMQPCGDGWHELLLRHARPGTRYRFLLPDGTGVPDPAARFQPQDVAGPSEVIDPAAYRWNDMGWQGRPWNEAVLYELHVGTFTPEGTFRAAAEKLPHLAQLGVTAIELMTISDFPGMRGWGYDGVLPFAPDSAYGRPEDLKALVDAAHALGLQVIFDVVYNHFGPEGNYISRYFPQICSSDHETAWGKGMNFDAEGSAEVRALFLHNAMYWVEEFHADGLRIDASHTMVDHSPKHILDEIAEAVRVCSGGREIHLILEDEQNVSQRLARAPGGAIPGFTAQWNHDMTHLLSAAFGNLCPERDPSGKETAQTAEMLAEGYVLPPGAHDHPEQIRCKVPPNAYIAFTQTHDLIGNRPDGTRLHHLVPAEAARAIEAVLLLLPQTPMLFMGQEWHASQPFPFFCDYHGELAEKVRAGRFEFLRSLHGEDNLRSATDPGAESTFRSAQLHWEELQDPAHAAELQRYCALLEVRRRAVAPLLLDLGDRCGSVQVLSPAAFVIRWKLAGRVLTLAANLCGNRRGGFPSPEGECLWLQGDAPSDGELGPWSVRWSATS